MKPINTPSDKPSSPLIKKKPIKVNQTNAKKKSTPESNPQINTKKKSIPQNNPLKDLGLDGLSVSELMTKYSLTGPKTKVLNELIIEYKKGQHAMSGLPNLSKYKELDKNKINKIISQYEKAKKKVVANIDQIKLMDKEELKNKFYLSGSKGKAFNQMIDDYRSGKISLTSLTVTKTMPKKLNKENIDQMIVLYEETKKNKKSHSTLRKTKDNDEKDDKDDKDQISVASKNNILKKTLRRSVWKLSKTAIRRNPNWAALLAENQINLDKINIDNMDISLINLDALGIDNGPLRRTITWLFK